MAGVLTGLRALPRGIAATAGRAWQAAGRVAQRGLKAAMQWTGRRGWGTMLLSGRSRHDYARDVGDGRGSAIVMACVLWIGRTFPEAPLIVRELVGAEWEPRPDHQVARLFRRPNRHYGGRLLWMAILGDWNLTGNAYLLKVRSAVGRVVELWWLPSWMVEPMWPESGTVYISHYQYTVNGRKILYPPEDIVHFRYGLDPYNTRKGLSPLASLLREVATDDEAANFTASVLRNMGVPGVILSPEEEVSGDDEDLQQVKTTFADKFGGDRRGEPMVVPVKMKVHIVSWNPQQMDLKALRRIPEERVSAVIGVPAIVAGLGAGLDRSTFANMAEAREAGYESGIIPTQGLLAEQIDLQLVIEFTDDPDRFQTGFDLSGVRVLQDDENKRATRLAVLYGADLIKRSEARTILGQESGPEDDGYKSELTPKPAPPAALPPPGGPGAKPPVDDMDGMDEVDEEGRPKKPKALPPGRKSFVADEEWYTRAGNDIRQLTATAAPSLALLFRLTGRRVAEAVDEAGKGRKALPEDGADLVPTTHAADLEAAIAAGHEAAIATAGTSVAEGLGLSFQLPFEVRQAVLAELATRIGGIAETTREDVRRIVRDALAEGASIDELKRRLAGLFEETYRGRARTIARTESATAYNRGSVLAYRESGVVVAVRVHDGDADGACRAANGSRWSLDKAERSPIEHPNCVRAFAPVVEEAG